VSAWGGQSVAAFRQANDRLSSLGRIAVGRHPSAILLNRKATRLYVALASQDRIAIVNVAPALAGPGRLKPALHYLADATAREGSTPNALALSADESTLFVAEADNNAVAVFEKGKLVGRIPTDWYPSALIARGQQLFILNAKGSGTRPNPTGPTADRPIRDPRTTYTMAMINGTIRLFV